MKSRLTVASISLVGMLGLILVGFLVDGPHPKANAQRATFRETGQTAEPFGQLLSSGNKQSEVTRSATSGFRQPHRGLSVASTQSIVIAVKGGLQMSGEPVDLAVFEFGTIFGPVAIPVNAIAGLKMSDDPRQQATICLSNGDSLTGVLATDSVTIKTPWGGATIGRDHIVSIVTSTEPVAWHQRNGRWMIAQVRDPNAVGWGETVAEDDLAAPLPPSGKDAGAAAPARPNERHPSANIDPPSIRRE